MNTIIKQIEKRKVFFQKISQNIYLSAIRDGFLSAMPVILFSSIFILLAALPEVFGLVLPEALVTWLWKIYDYSMGIIGLLVAGTTARCLAVSMNRTLPKGKVINETSVLLAAITSFLILAVIKKDGAFLTDYMGTKGLLSSFISAFVTVNLYKFCVLKDITIKMPKEVPGSISQNFRDVFPFSFAILTNAIIDLLSRHFLNVPFAESFSELLSPLFTAAESYLGISIIWLLVPLFWFVGVHGPSVVKPGLASALFGNTEANLELFKAGQHPIHVLTENFGNFIGEFGGTGATFVVPIIFILLMKSKQLKAVGKSSIIPVMFAVNEPLLFAAPIILNPYFFIPFILAPVVNVCIGKFFIDVLNMNGFMYILPWATPGPIGTILATGFQPISILLPVVLIAVDILIYLPFCKAYDKVLLEQENLNAEVEDVVKDVREKIVNEDEKKIKEIEQVTKTIEKEINVLVLCAGAGTSAMLANTLTEGAKNLGVPISASAGAYGSHYQIMEGYDIIILAPQVAVNFENAKEDAKKYGIKVVATKGVEYIKLTKDPQKAVDFIMDLMKNKME